MSTRIFPQPIRVPSIELVHRDRIDERATLHAEGVWQTGDIQLSDSEIRALAGTPQALVAAPGANRAVIVHALYAYLFRPTNSFDDAAADGNLNLKYAGAADASGGLTAEADAFIDAGASTGRLWRTGYDYVAGAALVVTPVANVAVVLDNNGAEFTSAADTVLNTLSLRVWYSVIDLAAFGS